MIWSYSLAQYKMSILFIWDLLTTDFNQMTHFNVYEYNEALRRVMNLLLLEKLAPHISQQYLFLILLHLSSIRLVRHLKGI